MEKRWATVILGPMFDWILKKALGTKHQRELKRLQPKVAAISALEGRYKAMSDEDLRAQTAQFREQIDQGATLDSLLIPAFATCREAAVRSLKMRHYDVQLIGGMVLHEGKIAEMKTGEGKTLVATLACYLNALAGKGVHVVTVNDYLASRDAEWMSQLYGFLGLSTGVVVPQQRDADKKRAYRCDITYGQNNEFGFDYLRDNMKFSIYDYVQRPLNFAIVDEVDSILVDEARTPLIISGPGETASEKYTRIGDLIPKLRGEEHYVLDEKARSVTLTEEGMERCQQMLFQQGITETENLYDPVNLETLHILQQSLRAHTLYKRDQHYMVGPDSRVMIIDEFTGRVLAGRRWSDGLHQAIEAKERVSIQDENITLATISFQNLFRLYEKLAGMTGTADTEATEFHSIYKLDVVVIPTNKPIQRLDDEDLIYRTEKEKFRAVAEEIREANERGQPVLVGTTSVEKSDALSRMLRKQEVPHNVLNAKQHEREAYVVAQAGRKGAVTVATNMAGRGTDILLGGNPEMLARMSVMNELAAEAHAASGESAPPRGPVQVQVSAALLEQRLQEALPAFRAECEAQKQEVLAAGGLHIVGTERHESRRIDNQLRGRSGRQGDPGSSRFYLSLEDDLMRIFGGERLKVMMGRLGMEEDVPIESKLVSRSIENAQKKVEERNFDIRKHMLEYDDVLNQQRKSVYNLRRQVLTGQYRTVPTDEQKRKGVVPKPIVTRIDETLKTRVEPVVTDMLKFFCATPPEKDATQAQMDAFRKAAQEASLDSLTELRYEALEREIYVWFGCCLKLRRFRSNPKDALPYMIAEISQSLTEQKERMLDLVDEIIGRMVEHACPPQKHPEDWDIEGLQAAYKKQFRLELVDVAAIGDRQELAQIMYRQAEKVLLGKAEEFGQDNFLRLFRNFFLQDIDKQWIEHLQSMDQLRDGIGLRGYGQRDPKKEYKKEGYLLFLQMIESAKASVASNLFRVERVAQEDLQRLEAERRKQTEARQQHILAAQQAKQLAESQGQGGSGDNSGVGNTGKAAKSRSRSQGSGTQANTSAASASPPQIKRDRPKIGRNDPCWCGSGKKYKHCHYRIDQEASQQSVG